MRQWRSCLTNSLQPCTNSMNLQCYIAHMQPIFTYFPICEPKKSEHLCHTAIAQLSCKSTMLLPRIPTNACTTNYKSPITCQSVTQREKPYMVCFYLRTVNRSKEQDITCKWAFAPIKTQVCSRRTSSYIYKKRKYPWCVFFFGYREAWVASVNYWQPSIFDVSLIPAIRRLS